MRRTTSVRETRIFRPADGRLVARASTLWAHVDLATRRPVRVENAARRAFDPLETGVETGVDR
jgi:acyl-CoA thioesterase FadM